MEIRINALRLRNFKGVRQAEYYFGGRNARIEGPNGSGKSTVFDAFTWLLFGKDHRDQTADTFEIKTIDPATGRPYPREDHWVEAVLTVDGVDHVLRRAWVENWVKPTGQIEDVMKGHTSAFYVDGVDVGTKRAYDAAVAAWLKEDTFKLLTNPHYFIDDAFTPWKARRKALLGLVADAPERARVREEFADVVEKLSNRTIEDYRKRLAMERSANKRDLDDVLNRIAGMTEALPPEVDEAEVKARLDALRAERDRVVDGWKEELKGIDRAIASADEADAARKAENSAIWAEITKVQLAMGNYTAEATKAAQAQNNAREQDLIRVRANVQAAQAKMRAEKAQEDRARAELDVMERDRGRMASELADLGVKYEKEKGRAFSFTADTKCPYCGQEIPAATVEKAREKARQDYLAERKAAIDGILEKARAWNDDVKKLDGRIAGQKDVILKAEEEYAKASAEASKWSEETKRVEAQPVADLAAIEAQARGEDGYKALVRKEQELRSKALKTSSRPDDVQELVESRKAIEAKIQAEQDAFTRQALPLHSQLSVNGVRKDQLALIEQKKREARNFADALANCERLEARAAAFVKADIDSVEVAINGLFRVARWKMFDTTMDGGIVEMCEVCDPDGTPYRSMNDAMKILCGIDVIRVFSERYGSSAPIFIDNAEGILRESFDTPAQVIRLVVADTAKINLVNE